MIKTNKRKIIIDKNEHKPHNKNHIMFVLNRKVKKMNINERRKLIETEVLDKGKIDIEDLEKMLGVSAMTIRRDLMHLEKENKLIRTHGGAVPVKRIIDETSYENKEKQYLEEKKAIAAHAATIVRPGDTIILDSGTTTHEIARVLKNRENLTVITNDILIAAEFLNTQVHVVVTGGELQNQVGAMFGPHTESLLEDIHVDLLFLGTHAVHPAAGITAPTLEKAKVKRLMVQAAEKTWLVADHSKFGKSSFASVCRLEALQGIITNDNVSSKESEAYHDTIIRVPSQKEGNVNENRSYRG
jgi:DeoR/GlpR family transcriptional regulator of sugar metabolism